MYAIGREGIAKRKLTDDSKDLTPLLDVILEQVPASPLSRIEEPLTARHSTSDMITSSVVLLWCVCTQASSICLCRYLFVMVRQCVQSKSPRCLLSKDLQKEVSEVVAGDIALIAGIADAYIGETICGDQNTPALPAIAIDEPTISLRFLVNDSPFAGREGKFVTSRQIRERLERELEINVGLKVDFNDDSTFTVYGRVNCTLQSCSKTCVVKDMNSRSHNHKLLSKKKMVTKQNHTKNLPGCTTRCFWCCY